MIIFSIFLLIFFLIINIVILRDLRDLKRDYIVFEQLIKNNIEINTNV